MGDFQIDKIKEPVTPELTHIDNNIVIKTTYRKHNSWTPLETVVVIALSILGVAYLVTFWEDGLLLEIIFNYINHR